QALTALRERMQALQKQPRDPAVVKELLELRQKIGDSVQRISAPVLSEHVTLEISIAPNAEPGPRQLRLTTALGLSNPLIFCVGQLPEFLEKDVKKSPVDMELPVVLPAVVNGRLIPGDIDRVRFPGRLPPQYLPGDVDRYRFSAHQGQHLVFAVNARDLMPYLADAVPGWFQAALTLYDAHGHEVGYNDDYRFHPDPVLYYEVPSDGDYVLEIKDALYRGREDFVYRITMGEIPFLTGVFPLGGRAGKSMNVELTGWNLPSTKLNFDGRKKNSGTFMIDVLTPQQESNRLPFAIDTLPEVFEKGSNNTLKSAQLVKLPVIINGRIDQPGEWDVFKFKGRRGEALVAEVRARRLESPLDSELELTDATGRRLAFNDDFEDKAAGLETHHADSFLMATLPKAGTYFIRIGDIQHKGGQEYAYRLRLSEPRPDFDLMISPSSINTSGGATVPVTVTAVRRDGLVGDIELALKDAPSGFALNGGVVPAGQDQVRFTLTVPPTAIGSQLDLHFEGRASIQGRTITHVAQPAEDMMQAFAYRHLVATDNLRVSVGRRGGTRVSSRLLSAAPIKIPAGGSAPVRVAIPPGYATFEKLQFELNDSPEGVTLSDLSVAQAGAQFMLRADRSKLKPGLRGNLIVAISGERVPPANAPNPNVRRRLPLGTLPAIPFEITGP
ncbi:MAG: hypothetical protein PHX83_17390, partial [Acidobacteriia bacterium]|nr:hypothetical protein [Terriglobia bacterium]